MSASQVVLEFIKTIGLGSLLGVLVGLGATRRQKSREVLQNIKIENYREVVGHYRELLAQLLRIKDAARRAVLTAKTRKDLLDNAHSNDGDEVSAYIESKFDDDVEKYEVSLDGLEEKISNLIVHRSETSFHSQASRVQQQALYIAIWLDGIKQFKDSSEDIQRATEAFNEFEKSVGILGLLWDEWKIEAERYAAGLRPVPRFRRLRQRLERRL